LAPTVEPSFSLAWTREGMDRQTGMQAELTGMTLRPGFQPFTLFGAADARNRALINAGTSDELTPGAMRHLQRGKTWDPKLGWDSPMTIPKAPSIFCRYGASGIEARADSRPVRVYRRRQGGAAVAQLT
jgi:hypothetical protein